MCIRDRWRSNGEKTFDDFLSRFNSNQRKNIKKERKSITKQDIKVEIFNEDDINQEILKKMHNFYEQHCSRWGVWGSKYLTSTFFEKIVANKKNKDKKEITNLLINHIESFAITNKILSCNFLYVDESWGNHLKSLGYYEWINSSSEWRSNGEKTFDDFLSRFNSNQRKNIKKERKSIAKQDAKAVSYTHLTLPTT